MMLLWRISQVEGSQRVYEIFLVGESAKLFPIWWNSKKIKQTAGSTHAGETISMSEAVSMAVFISILFSELTIGKTYSGILPIVCVTDCKLWFKVIIVG